MTGRARMEVIPDFRSETLTVFLKDNVAPGSTVYTDGLKSFTGLNEAGSNTFLAANRHELTCERARSPLCHSRTGQLATSSSGWLELTTA